MESIESQPLYTRVPIYNCKEWVCAQRSGRYAGMGRVSLYPALHLNTRLTTTMWKRSCFPVIFVISLKTRKGLIQSHINPVQFKRMISEVACYGLWISFEKRWRVKQCNGRRTDWYLRMDFSKILYCGHKNRADDHMSAWYVCLWMVSFQQGTKENLVEILHLCQTNFTGWPTF